jgi:hypothetical protein
MVYKKDEVTQTNIVKAENGYIINVYRAEMEDGELPRIIVAINLEEALQIARESLKE